MKNIWSKIAAVLAVIIGAMAFYAGGKVLLGNDPGYYVINWLPVYNYSIGFLTLFVTSIILWRNSKLAMPVTIGTISLHGIVMVIIQTVYRDVVAPDSIRAMTIRLTVWAVILGLMLLETRQKKTSLVEQPG